MRTRFIAVAFLLLLCGAVLAAEKPPMDIPVYPGGESTMEINLTNDDLLPTLKAVLPLINMPGIDKLNLDDLGVALKDVKRIELLQVDIKKTATESDVADFYAKKIPSGAWNRVFWQRVGKQGTLALYVQGQGEKLYGFRVQSVVEDEKPVKKVQIVKTEGKIDYAKLMVVAAKMYMP